MVTKTAHVSQKQSLMGNGQESTLHGGHLLALEQSGWESDAFRNILEQTQILPRDIFFQPCL